MERRLFLAKEKGAKQNPYLFGLHFSFKELTKLSLKSCLFSYLFIVSLITESVHLTHHGGYRAQHMVGPQSVLNEMGE